MDEVKDEPKSESKSETGSVGGFENKLKESFFGTSVGRVFKKKEPVRTEINTKTVNRKFTEQWDIRFSIGSKTFTNIVEFLSGIGYDVILKFRKSEMIIYIIDVSSTHVSYISVSKNEFAEYEAVGITDENEKVVYIDISIVDDLIINEDYSVDVYIDTITTKTFHIAHGKQVVSRRLNSMDDNLSQTLQSYKKSDEKMHSLIEDNNYQKIVVIQSALKSVLNSVSKKGGKDKDNKLMNIHLGVHNIDFRVEGELKKSSILLSGEDIMVYPMTSEVIEITIDYFKKFNKLELSFPVSLYCRESMPFVFETKLGGGGIRCYFVIAPRVNIEQ